LKKQITILGLLFITMTSCSVIKFPFKALKKINKPSIKKNSSNKLEAFLRNMSSDERKKWYIKTYSKIATEQMNKYKIPASIILAQGIVESGAGASNLALKSNNHFGIKCHQDWSGKKVYHDDDKKNECFRKYKNVVDSYKDHSEFLSKRGRYSFLFRLPKNDYIKWSYGLKKAGYATDPKYPNKLINMIESYDLWKFDGSKKKISKSKKSRKEKNKNEKVHTVQKGDTLYSISKKYNSSIEIIRKNNNLKSDIISIGQKLKI